MSTEMLATDSNSASLLQKNNQQIAHDLRSPLSALNFVSSLNPDMPEESRSLLQMAIDRLETMAKQLETK